MRSRWFLRSLHDICQIKGCPQFCLMTASQTARMLERLLYSHQGPWTESFAHYGSTKMNLFYGCEAAKIKIVKKNFALVFRSNSAILLRNTPNFLGSDKKKLEMDSKISFFPMVWLSSQSLNSHVCIAWKIFYEKKVHLCNGPWFSKSVMMQIQMNAKFVGDIRKWEKPMHNTLKQK